MIMETTVRRRSARALEPRRASCLVALAMRKSTRRYRHLSVTNLASEVEKQRRAVLVVVGLSRGSPTAAAAVAIMQLVIEAPIVIHSRVSSLLSMRKTRRMRSRGSVRRSSRARLHRRTVAMRHHRFRFYRRRRRARGAGDEEDGVVVVEPQVSVHLLKTRSLRRKLVVVLVGNFLHPPRLTHLERPSRTTSLAPNGKRTVTKTLIEMEG